MVALRYKQAELICLRRLNQRKYQARRRGWLLLDIGQTIARQDQQQTYSRLLPTLGNPASVPHFYSRRLSDPHFVSDLNSINPYSGHDSKYRRKALPGMSSLSTTENKM